MVLGCGGAHPSPMVGSDTGRSSAETPPPVRIRTLVVDDSDLMRETTVAFLRQNPVFDVIDTAGNGLEAVNKATELMPDLVLMDMTMPHMNGVEATRRIKASPDAPRVVMLTMHDSASYRDAALAAKADGYIQKPNLARDLLPLVRALFLLED